MKVELLFFCLKNEPPMSTKLKVNDEDCKPANEGWNIQLHVFGADSMLNLSYLTMFSGSYVVFLMFILNSDIWET
jgi:hypothetical protein